MNNFIEELDKFIDTTKSRLDKLKEGNHSIKTHLESRKEMLDNAGISWFCTKEENEENVEYLVYHTHFDKTILGVYEIYSSIGKYEGAKIKDEDGVS